MSAALDWVSTRPVTVLDKVSGYIDLPVFTYPVVWLGASTVITQFNYATVRALVLRNRPTKPTGANYVLAIRYRIGATVYRYTLWEDAACTLVAPPYTGQVIKGNFVLEAWSLNGQAVVSQAAAIRIYTSLKRLVTDFAVAPSDYEAGASEEVSNQNNTNVCPLPTDGLLARYSGDDGPFVDDGSGNINSWGNTVSGSFSMVSSAPKPILTGYNFPAGLHQIVHVKRGGGFVATYPLTNINKGYLFGVIRQHAWTLNDPLFSVLGSISQKFEIRQSPVTPKYDVVAGVIVSPDQDAGLVIGQWHIFWLQLDGSADTNAELVNAQVDDSNSIGSAGAYAGNGLNFYVAGDQEVAELLLYRRDPVFDPAFVAQVKDYLSVKYGLSIPLDIEFDGGTAGQDNA